MRGLGAFSVGAATRKELEAATRNVYREEKPEEFERMVRWRLADSSSASSSGRSCAFSSPATPGRPTGEEPREPEGRPLGFVKAFRGWMSRVRAWIGLP